jgi:hypothetical protein
VCLEGHHANHDAVMHKCRCVPFQFLGHRGASLVDERAQFFHNRLREGRGLRDVFINQFILHFN